MGITRKQQRALDKMRRVYGTALTGHYCGMCVYYVPLTPRLSQCVMFTLGKLEDNDFAGMGEGCGLFEKRKHDDG